MSQLIIAGDTSGTVTLQAPAVAGSTTLSLPSTTGNVVTTTSTPSTSGNILSSDGTNWVSSPPLTVAGSQSMVGTDIALFSNIPSWVKKITVVNFGASGSPAVRLGTASGIVATGYTCVYYSTLSSNQTSAGSSTTQFQTQSNDGTFTLFNVSGNTWSYASNHCNSGNRNTVGTGYITLAAPLTQIQVIGIYTTGTVNAFYE